MFQMLVGNTVIPFCIGCGNKRYLDLLKKRPEMDDVVPLLKTISASWNDIGCELKVPFNDRQTLLRDLSQNDAGKLETVLHNWIGGTQETDVTWEMLLKALESCGNKNIAIDVTIFLNKPEVYKKYIGKHDFVCT